MEDHTGSFSTALEGVDILGIETADNEYAVGRVVEAVSHSPQSKDNTLVFVVEDDAQDGTDHVDAHQSIAIMAGAFVKRGAVVSKWYTTVSLISTIVDILGIEHLGLNDANAEPMADCFQKKPQKWTFNGSIPAIPKASTTLPLPVNARNVQPSNQVLVAKDSKLLHSAAWWAEQTESFDFSAEDKVDAGRPESVSLRATCSIAILSFRPMKQG